MFSKSSIVDTLTVLLVTACSSQRKRCHYLEIYWYVFYGNWTEYRNLHYKSPNSAQIRENTDQKNFQYGTFSRSATINKYRKLLSKKRKPIFQFLTLRYLMNVLYVELSVRSSDRKCSIIKLFLKIPLNKVAG